MICSQGSHLHLHFSRAAREAGTQRQITDYCVFPPAIMTVQDCQKKHSVGKVRQNDSILMNVGPVRLFFVLGSKDRPSNVPSDGLCPEDTNPALGECLAPFTPGAMKVLGAAKPPPEDQGFHPLNGC